MSTEDQKAREAFEAWIRARSAHAGLARYASKPADYKVSGVQLAWESWQASRSSLMSNAAPEVDRSAVRREALEEAAKICRMNHRHTLSRAIRALADPPQGKETPR